VEFILHRLGLETYRKARWHEIAGGFQMRFELAKALVGQPKLLILDEPLAPLDINTQQLFLQDLRDFADSSSNPLPIILSSQHIYEVEAIADSILFLDRGEVVFSGALDELFQKRKESAYEFTSLVDKSTILERLEPLRVIEVERTGLIYIVSVPPEVTGREVLDCLLRANIDIKYFRDISGSSRKFFKGRGE
jgi:ABC-2 type transport system ATP-binding protein